MAEGEHGRVEMEQKGARWSSEGAKGSKREHGSIERVWKSTRRALGSMEEHR